MDRLPSRYLLSGLVLAALFSAASCDLRHVRLRPVEMQLYDLYDRDVTTNMPVGCRAVFFDPYSLVISESNRFSVGESDIRNITVDTEAGRYYVNFFLKKARYSDFARFTTVNSNSYVAVMVNGKIRTIARIREPVRNGRLQFVSGLTQSGEIRRFIRLFVR